MAGSGPSAGRGGVVQETPSGGASARVGGGREGSVAGSSTEDLMVGSEPSFVGVLLNPRRSLRVINRD